MSTNGGAGVQAQALGKRFDDFWALRNLDLSVPPGSVLGLLGHNGAGKTTAIRILTTLSIPTEGSAKVAGHDVVDDAEAVRSRIGLASQSATVDGLLTARANLELVGKLYHLPKDQIRKRADDLLERLDLTDAATKLVKTFSGGMRRRLDLAATLVASPPVLFLDEPTTGLDPASRNDLWDLLRDLVNDGTTIVLTTQYLEEADKLADNIVLLDHGKTIATGPPAELKSQVGGQRVEVVLSQPGQKDAVTSALSQYADGDAWEQEAGADGEGSHATVTLPVKPGTGFMDVVRSLDSAKVPAIDVHRREATLDDVFLTLTGSTGHDEDDAEATDADNTDTDRAEELQEATR